MKFSKVLSGALLVAGTTIGAGMLGPAGRDGTRGILACLRDLSALLAVHGRHWAALLIRGISLAPARC